MLEQESIPLETQPDTLSKADVTALGPAKTLDTLDLISKVVLSGNVPVETVERLVGLHERMQEREAALEFARALAKFQDECPAIPRSSKAKIATKSGSGYEFSYADFEQIIETTRPALRENGFSLTFDARMNGALMEVGTTLRHVNGHSVQSWFPLPVTSSSGMSDQQRHGAALTYGKRQGIISVLGLSLTDPDPENEGDPTKIDEEQTATIRALLDEVGGDTRRFFKWAGVTDIADIRAAQYDSVIAMLERKRSRPKGGV